MVKSDQTSVFHPSILYVEVAMRAITRMLLLLVLTVTAQGSNPAPSFTSIVEHMERAQSEIRIPNHVTRDYRFGRQDSAKVDSDVFADIDFRTGKYTVKKLSGSGAGVQVVKRILEQEVSIAASSQKSRLTAVTHENYVFSDLGETILDGQSYYLLRLDPKRPKQPELISGQVWVDKQSFLIRRIEGGVKSSSWWVKTIHVRLDFASPRGMWVLSGMEAVANVRYLGDRKLTSQMSSFSGEAASVVAAKSTKRVRIARGSLAVSVLK
jgi:hypothetical protein